MSAFSISEPFPQFHDRAGQPLDGGFVWIGAAGLDAQANPIPVFFDAALTIPASQPIGTRSGFAANGATPTPVYCDANDYSIKILDANGTLVSSYANAADRFPATVITGALSSANVSYTRGLAGTPTRTVEGRLRDFTSVFDFMTPAEIAAVQASTFLVNVTSAVQNALTSSAREVYFPPGGYLVGDFTADPALWLDTVSVGKTIRGAGRQATVIRNNGIGATIGSTGNPITPNTSIHICDLSLEGQAGTGPGILFDYTSQSVIERVDCYNHGSSGIRIINGAHVSIVDAWSRSNTGVALDINDDAYFVDVRGGTFETSASGAFVMPIGPGAFPRYVTFTGCTFRGNTNSNVDVGQSADVRFFGCSFNVSGATTTRHLSVDGGAGLASSVVVDACSFYGINGAATTVGVYANACEDVAVTNSVLDVNGATAYDVKASALRTRFFDNAVINGTQTNASTSTFTRTTLTGSSSLGFGGGEGLVNFDALANALKFKRVPVSNAPLPGTTQLGVLQLRALDSSGTFTAEYRLWARAGNLVLGTADPASIVDGITVGPGVQTYAFATRPATAPVGTIIKITDSSAFLGWGQVETGGGIIERFIIHTGGNVWTIIGNA